MNNFFIDDTFYDDLGRLMITYDIEDPTTLPDDWKEVATESSLEPVWRFTVSDLVEAVCTDRVDEDGYVLEDIERLVAKWVDFSEINANMPELYYPTKNTFTITKQDLIDYVQ